MILENFKNDVFVSFPKIVSVLITMSFIPAPSRDSEVLPSLVREVSAKVVRAARTYHVMNRRQMTDVQFASVFTPDQTLHLPGHLRTSGTIVYEFPCPTGGIHPVLPLLLVPVPSTPVQALPVSRPSHRLFSDRFAFSESSLPT